MRFSRKTLAIAASVVAVCLAAPIGLYLVTQQPQVTPGGLSGQFNTVSGTLDRSAPSGGGLLSRSVAPTAPQGLQPRTTGRSNSNYAARSRGKRAFESGQIRSAARAPVAAIAREPTPPRQPQMEGRDQFEGRDDNPVRITADVPVSTFSLDVDTASYAFVRRTLTAGRLPQKAAVRTEELINYFDYKYPVPETREAAFKPTITVVPSPWSADHELIHIAVKGYELQATERPRANLVFLLDVSGSMRGANRLPLLKNAFRMLVENLKPDDTIGIVKYASGTGVVLEPTKVSDKTKIFAAIDGLSAGGSTAGAQGIQDAYRLAESVFDKDAVNRVLIGTDGDFNVGITDRGELKSFIERKRKTGIYLSILGFGRGNYNDALMQTLAQNGNGVAAYIDTINEARKVLVEEAAASLFPIATDVKIQVEFNRSVVESYRLIGYETRQLRREDFNNDRVDAGDVGSGKAVTAIYEIKRVGQGAPVVDDLRYGANPKPAAASEGANDTAASRSNELGFFKLRYKRPGEAKSRLLSTPITDGLKVADLDRATDDVRFAIAVAGFGQLLKGGPWTGDLSYDDVIKLALSARGDDPFGLRSEFVQLVRLAKLARP
ncbi:MAG: VWA domain-containing protein [Pseudomonadota bacterium]